MEGRKGGREGGNKKGGKKTKQRRVREQHLNLSENSMKGRSRKIVETDSAIFWSCPL